jgi:ABC-2 type transport system permease protein
MIRHWLDEYREFFHNQGAVLILIGAIIIYSFFYPLPYRAEVLREVPLAVVDLDYSELSRMYTRMLDANEYLSVTERPKNFEEAKQLFYAGQVGGILVIPRKFERDIRRGETTTVSTYYDTTSLLIYKQLKTGITFTTRTMGAGIQVKRFLAAGYGMNKAKASMDPLPLVTIPLYNPGGGYGGYIIPAVFALALHQVILIGIGMVTGGRRERLSAANPGVHPGFVEALAMVFGKAGAYLTISLSMGLYALFMSHCYYGFPLRSVRIELFLFVLPFLLSTIMLGITLGNLFRSREVAVAACLFSSLPNLFLVGFSWPPEGMPVWLRCIAYAIPNTMGVDGFLKINQMGAPLRDLGFDYHMLWILTGVYFVTAWLGTRATRMPVAGAAAAPVGGES